MRLTDRHLGCHVTALALLIALVACGGGREGSAHVGDAPDVDVGADSVPLDVPPSIPLVVDDCSLEGLTDGWACTPDGDPCTWDGCLDGRCVHPARTKASLPFPDGFFAVSAVESLDTGGLLLGGTLNTGRPTGDEDWWVRATDALGRLRWQRLFGGPSHDALSTSVALPGRGVVVGGTLKPDGARFEDVSVVELDHHGEISWEATFATPFGSYLGLNLTADPSGGVVLPCMMWSPEGGITRDGWVMGLDRHRQVVFQQRFGGPQDDLVHNALRTSGGDLVACGFTEESRLGGRGAWVLRFSPSGEILWERTWEARHACFHCLPMADDGVLCAGSTFSDAWIFRLDAAGETRWEVISELEANDGGPILIRDATGRFVVGGTAGDWTSQPQVLAVTEDGELLAHHVFDSVGDQATTGLVTLPEGGIGITTRVEMAWGGWLTLDRDLELCPEQ